ncbi:MAG: CD1871A family CXXC motif-containing protein [Sphaerochaetaceae bacterium]|jgi:hypothetical protein
MGKNHRFHITAAQLSALIFLIAGLVFIGIGLARSEHLIVLRKATLLCMECIGLG